MVTNKAFNGDSGSDPLDFQNFKLNYVAAFIDGECIPPSGYTPDFDSTNGVMTEYWALLSTLNEIGPDTSLNYTIDQFKQHPIIAINFAPDVTAGCGSDGHVNPIQNWNFRFEIRI